ncbi:uncharacterized protein LOC115620715 [Scaptodrosophila lebanonensis]|uniref:Uncharacterized protein LOC115620715 n=1 Tax=Drosophila lebanonensis TaxID=7225 RepID=A0A6J2T4X1_DROLE|nr:uncharacterized protein LOC115620715 [Scaptodrosophila lebanonensis]
MNSAFGNVFLFLTDLAWKSRLTIPVLVTTAFLVMDIRLQIEINIQSGQVNASDLEDEVFEERLAEHHLHDVDEESDIYSDDLEEYTNDEGNSSDASRYSLDVYDDMGSEYDVDEELDCYWSNDTNA